MANAGYACRVSDVEQDALFAASRETFVAERQRLARTLKLAGHTKEAAELARIPKPTLAAWVVNQLARQRRSLVKQLGAAGARLRDVQLGMSGGGGVEARQAFARAATEHREALSALRAAAEEILTAAGNSAPPHLLETILRTLRAGGASDIAQATIEQGRLLRDIEEQDLGALAAVLPGAGPGLVEEASPAPRGVSFPLAADKSGKAAADVKREEEHAHRAEERARQAAQQAAARAAEQARARERDDTRREVTERQQAAEKAAKEQARYEEEVMRAREILADAERRLAAARAAAETATARLTEAQSRLRALSS